MPRRKAHAEAKKCVPPPLDLPTADEKREAFEDALKLPRGWLKRPYRLARAIKAEESNPEYRRELIRWLCAERGRPMGEAFDPQEAWRTLLEVREEMEAMERGFNEREKQK